MGEAEWLTILGGSVGLSPIQCAAVLGIVLGLALATFGPVSLELRGNSTEGDEDDIYVDVGEEFEAPTTVPSQGAVAYIDGRAVSISPSVLAEVRTHLARKRMPKAITAVRRVTGLGLVESKTIVELLDFKRNL